jgi:DNA-binding PadR family transcriptional regulator
MEIITRLEEIILLAIWRLGDNAYGVTIHKEVSQLTGKTYTMGSLYFSLAQLHRKKYIQKTVSDPTPERGGRSKVFYSLTPSGAGSLQAVRELEESLWDGVPKYVFDKKTGT